MHRHHLHHYHHHTQELRCTVRVFNHGFCCVRVRVSVLGLQAVRCTFSDGFLHSRMPLDPTHVRLKLLHARDQWHSSRVPTTSYRLAWHCKFRHNTVGLPPPPCTMATTRALTMNSAIASLNGLKGRQDPPIPCNLFTVENCTVRVFHHGFCRVRASAIGCGWYGARFSG
jgi:hypothetical protein